FSAIVEARPARSQRALSSDLEAAADRAVRGRDWAAALERAARAVVLLPRDRTIAALYFRAAEGSRAVRHRIAALEHLASVVPRTPALLGEIAELHRQAGDGGRARGALEEASRLLASSRRARRGAAERLAEIAARLDAGAPEPPAVPDDTPPALRFTPPPPPPEPEPPAAAARLEIPVTLASDIACLDALGDQPGSPADATLALMATGLADAESFHRLLSLAGAAKVSRAARCGRRLPGPVRAREDRRR